METKQDDGLTRYRDFRPTGFDSHIELEDREDWILAPAMQTRDSGALDRSNFRVILADLGGESETVEVHRFGHWGPGWFEIILAHPSLADAVYEWERALENYPVADEEDWSREELEEFHESWDFWGRSDFGKELAKMVHEQLEDIVTDDLDLDDVWQQAAQHMGWEYQGEDSGIRINIEDAIEECLKRGILAKAICNYIRNGEGK